MRNHPRSERRRRPATGDALFPSTWPWRALSPFCEELLATVYPKSADLWQELRSTYTGVSGWLEYHDYEGDIKRDDALSTVVGLIPVWPDAEVKFRQAQTLLGRDAWNSMVATRAEGIDADGIRPSGIAADTARIGSTGSARERGIPPRARRAK